MCIRDSLLPSWLLVAITAVASLTGPLSNSGLRSLFPRVVPEPLWAVSYTHLDVYKRQEVDRPLAGGRPGEPHRDEGAAAAAALVAAPVDVRRLPQPLAARRGRRRRRAAGPHELLRPVEQGRERRRRDAGRRRERIQAGDEQPLGRPHLSLIHI